MIKPSLNLDDLEAIRLGIASPEKILSWSHGEVTKPETINYRTQKPEKDGLFCERIFGPTKDWECYCGKYKRIRYKGVVCDKCGVEVTRSLVRRERMGHIDLAVPVVHMWYLRGTSSKIGLVLGLSIKELEQVVYFASYVITSVEEELKKKAISQLDGELKDRINKTRKKQTDEIANLKKKETDELKKIKDAGEKKVTKEKYAVEISLKEKELSEELIRLEDARRQAEDELKNLKPMSLISEQKYRDLSMKYGQVFSAGIGAEAIFELLKKVDLDKLSDELAIEVAESTGQKKRKALKRTQLVESLKRAGVRPEWMILNILPVIPPDLRPMVQLDGGRFAASDLNDLYRRVINRNNRLKRLIELGAPEVICRNEKRMLQEAVDALIDNSARKDKAVSTGAGRRKLKSLSDILKGKQGRFRQNLLGKRVDYSGRSVIVVGPELGLDQCGIPKVIALELFKPFVISLLIREGYAHNVKSAGRMIEQSRPEVWDMLEEVTKEKLVMLNRAPTLHRLGIQAFKPILIEGKAIQIHPLVCAAFNADFDGDQMAVHLPLSITSQKEAREKMASVTNLLKPSSGEPVVTPSQDMILGVYYMTIIKEGAKGEGKIFRDKNEAITAYQSGVVSIQAKTKVDVGGKILDTTVGRILFNNVLPKEMRFNNEVMDKKTLKKIVAKCFEKFGRERTVKLVDDLKKVGFEYATSSGATFSIADVKIPPKKKEIIAEGEKKADEIEGHYRKGLLTNDERFARVIEVWTEAKNKLTKVMMEEDLPRCGPIYYMINSGARGNEENMTQMAGMKGLVANPAGRTIELPIKANFKEGFSVLEYFISTHGGRKGKSDTALKTSDSGYLTRRLVDVAQDIIVSQEDCGDKEGFTLTKEESAASGIDFWERIMGRVALDDIKDGKTSKVIAKKLEEIDEKSAKEIEENENISEITIRSMLSCKSIWGVCQKCYGRDLARGGTVELGEAVGVIAAQSIGEPGTQLTMRTYHIGGVATEDITQGLPRVDELFEARAPKGEAVISEADGIVDIEDKEDHRLINVMSKDVVKDSYKIPSGYAVKAKSGKRVEAKDVIASAGDKNILAKASGIARVENDEVVITRDSAKGKEYKVGLHVSLKVKPGEIVSRGDQLSEGHINLQDLHELKGPKAVQEYVLQEVQEIYASQGQSINDKHIEIILRQMFSKVRIKAAGDTAFLIGDVTDKLKFERENRRVKKEKGKPAIGEQLLLGITRASLNVDSFLSAASFQETTRELIKAATTGQIDELRGLKENVIIGRLIPAGTGFDKSAVKKYL